jgi:hypothetical protein
MRLDRVVDGPAGARDEGEPMIQPWNDDHLWREMLGAEADNSGGDLSLLSDAPGDEPGDESGAAASGITSHVFARSGNRATSKSTFKPPHTTDAVFTRVAFFTADTSRLVLSDWRNKGSANPYKTLIQQWYFDDARARKALVLWSMNGSTWRSWAD